LHNYKKRKELDRYLLALMKERRNSPEEFYDHDEVEEKVYHNNSPGRILWGRTA